MLRMIKKILTKSSKRCKKKEIVNEYSEIYLFDSQVNIQARIGNSGILGSILTPDESLSGFPANASALHLS